MTQAVTETDEFPDGFRSGFIAVIGRPNVGKSTLLNNLLGQKIAITSDKPQTTRDQILGIRTDAGAQFIFLDTPGIHQPRNKLGKHMVNVAEQAIASDSDVILWLVDITTPPTDEDRYIVERLKEVLEAAGELPFLLLGANKVDSLAGAPVEDRKREYQALLRWLTVAGGQESVPVLTLSAATGDGVEALVAGRWQSFSLPAPSTTRANRSPTCRCDSSPPKSSVKKPSGFCVRRSRIAWPYP